MTDTPISRNFDFLRDYEPLLVECGLRAELYAYTDPNGSLFKSRLFGEVLAKSTALQAGMDCVESTFESTVGLLKRQRLISREVVALFTQLRTAGNAAAHEHENDQNAALQPLISAYELGKWFKQNVLGDSRFRPGPFRPPPKPEDATNELKEEIEFLRKEAARFELAASATDAEVEELSLKLEREAAEYHAALMQHASAMRGHDDELRRLKREYRERLKQVTAVADSERLQSFITRTEVSSSRIGNQEGELPLAQLRVPTGSTPVCCKAPMIVVQARNKSRSFSPYEFHQLPIFVACGQFVAKANTWQQNTETK